MSGTVAAWIVLGSGVVIVAAAVAAARWRARARRAFGPQGVGEALERGRRRVRDLGEPD